MEALHKQVLPFLLRRLKEDVLNDLPPKIIQDYYCELSDLQKQMYDDFSKSRAHQEAESAVRADNEERTQQQHVFQSLQYLRKLCNHPALVLKDDKQAIQDAFVKAGHARDSNLSDIQHAPKILALRYVLSHMRIFIHSLLRCLDNFSLIAESAYHLLSLLSLREASSPMLSPRQRGRFPSTAS